MRDELITKWKNSLVLNDEKELFEDIEAKVHNEEFVDYYHYFIGVHHHIFHLIMVDEHLLV